MPLTTHRIACMVRFPGDKMVHLAQRRREHPFAPASIVHTCTTSPSGACCAHSLPPSLTCSVRVITGRGSGGGLWGSGVPGAQRVCGSQGTRTCTSATCHLCPVTRPKPLTPRAALPIRCEVTLIDGWHVARHLDHLEDLLVMRRYIHGIQGIA